MKLTRLSEHLWMLTLESSTHFTVAAAKRALKYQYTYLNVRFYPQTGFPRSTMALRETADGTCIEIWINYTLKIDRVPLAERLMRDINRYNKRQRRAQRSSH
jgi:hypothetical protein